MIDISISQSIETTIGQADRRFYKMVPMTTMGDRIRARLKEIGQSQHWLAAKIGIKQPSVNAIINADKASGTKYIVEISEALGLHPKFVRDGVGPRLVEKAKEAKIVGKVGAGAAVVRFEDGVVLEGATPPPGEEGCLAARIEGDSMLPFRDGWLIFYRQEHDGVPHECLGKLSVVGLHDGTALVKILHKGSRKGHYDLESWNAPLRQNVRVLWASRVIDIRPVQDYILD